MIDGAFYELRIQTMDAETRSEIQALRLEIAELKLSRIQKALRAVRRNKRLAILIMVLAIIIPASLYALSITKSFTFTAGNPTVASEVNANFDQLFTKVNDLAAYHPPIGSIIAWHKDMLGGTPGLPASGEWVECNGQTLNDTGSNYHNRVIPNLNGDAAGANSPGQSGKVAMFLRGGAISGTGQQDAFQGHRHGSMNADFLIANQGLSAGTGGSYVGAGSFAATTNDPVTDGTNGTPRTANETRPVNMSVVWIMKVK